MESKEYLKTTEFDIYYKQLHKLSTLDDCLQYLTHVNSDRLMPVKIDAIGQESLKTRQNLLEFMLKFYSDSGCKTAVDASEILLLICNDFPTQKLLEIKDFNKDSLRLILKDILLL